MTRIKERVPATAMRVVRLQYEKDRSLLEQRAQIERRKEDAQRTHEWRIMLAEKGLFALLVGLALVMATICGNIVVERYKNNATVLQARTQAVRQSTNEVWTKLVVCEQAVGELGDKLQALRWHRGVDLFKDESVQDKKNFDDANAKATQSLQDLSQILQSEELNLGPDMHGALSHAMLDIALIRNLYETQGMRGQEPEKLYEDVIRGAYLDLTRTKGFILSATSQP